MKKQTLLILIVLFTLPLSAIAGVKGVFETLEGKAPKAGSLDVVTIHEVFAFSCPHCAHFNQEIPALKKHFGKKIKFVGHPVGWAGHDPGRLYFIAVDLGKEEAVKDMIFDFFHEKGLGDMVYQRERLKYVARFNGMLDEFEAKMDDPKYVKAMENSVQFAKDKKVESTPTLVVEGVFKTHGDPANLKMIINSLLKNPVR